MSQGQLILLSLALLLVIPAAAEQPTDYALEISNSEQQLLARFPIQQGNWCMHWKHSVTGIAVQDCYRTENQQMLLDHSWQPDFAAGLGHFEGRGTMTSHPEGGYLIKDINEPVAENRFWLRAGAKTVGHTLVSADQRLNLSQMAAGQRLQIRLITDTQPDN
ncbi:DUF1850 domain-containing protein [Nitrincola iocasae]|jgi:hypothetical protein|uniref:DUF1850 domain-containing protein n=1 Tax=Nitrincola iocasae TaxID=2614693 RepID=A0A5J6LCL4_9GAMM|nr:DUF1850 domain-containing protein [Nitrincola iocasae]QEW05961.1 DUF1850 domain-containing protein [Nitrincola iocasae]